MRKLSIISVFLLLLVGLFYLLFTLQIASKSKIAGYSLRVNRFRFAQFLIQNNYFSGEGLWKTASVTLTSERQPFMAVKRDPGLSPFQSVTIKNDQKSMSILAQYDNSALEALLPSGYDGQDRLNRTLLAYICVAQTENKTGLYEKEKCYQKATDYLESNGSLIFKLEKKSAKTGFHLVGTAHAAGCTGLVECELGETSCTCSVGGADCDISGSMCNGGLGTCNCTFSCTGSGGGAMDYYYCSSNTTRASCLSAGGAEALCQGKGMCAVGGGCFWINDDGTIATPSPGGGGGGCTCNCMNATSPKCNTIKDRAMDGIWFLKQDRGVYIGCGRFPDRTNSE